MAAAEGRALRATTHYYKAHFYARRARLSFYPTIFYNLWEDWTDKGEFLITCVIQTILGVGSQIVIVPLCVDLGHPINLPVCDNS